MIFVLIFFPALMFSQSVTCTLNIDYEVVRNGDTQKFTFIVVSATGANEDIARQELQQRQAELEKKAIEECKLRFENQSSCISQRLSSLYEYLAKADLSVRKTIEQTVIEECKKNSGTCKVVTQNEVKCTVRVSDNQTPQETSSNAEKKN